MSRPAMRWLVPVGLVAAATLLRILLLPVLPIDQSPFLFHWVALAAAGWVGGRRGALVGLAAAMATGLVLLLPPFGRWHALVGSAALEYILFGLTSLGVALLTGTLRQAVRSRTAAQADTRHAEAEARASETRFRGIIDSAMDAIISVSMDQRIVLFNPAAERIFRTTSAEVIGKPLDILLPDAARAAHREHVAQFGRTETTSRSMHRPGVLRGRRLDGDEFPIEATISKVEVGGEVLLTVILRDISERVSMEQQLLQSQRMEAIGRLAGGVAHDFNNLLLVINGLADLHREGRGTESELRQDLATILDAGQRAAQLTGQLLAFSRRQEMEPRVINPNDAVHEAVSMLRRLIGANIQVETALDPDVRAIEVDPGQLSQVLLNLAVNARDAMPDGGRLTIETANAALDTTYAGTHLGVASGEYVLIAVTDTGVGMDEQTRVRIFEPFFTTKPRGRGTGLGLSTVYGVVKQHGGAIFVYSEPGHGTTFKIYLPRARRAVTPLPSRATQQGGGGERILLVEDDEPVRLFLVRTLRHAGYDVRAAASGEEALGLAGDDVADVDLLVTDSVMPGLQGRELAERLRLARPELPVVFISGYTEDAMARRELAAARASFLQKPFTVDGLLAAVRTALDGDARRERTGS